MRIKTLKLLLHVHVYGNLTKVQLIPVNSWQPDVGTYISTKSIIKMMKGKALRKHSLPGKNSFGFIEAVHQW